MDHGLSVLRSYSVKRSNCPLLFLMRYASAKRAGHKVVAVFKETASGADNGRPQRAKVLALARAHEIDAILVTELSRWDRSTRDLVETLDDLHGWKVSVLAQTGLSFDMSTSTGKLMRAWLSSSAIE